MSHMSGRRWKRRALMVATLLAVPAAVPLTAGLASAASTTDALVAQYHRADYTATSWASFSSAKTKAAADGLVMVGGLKSMVADYRTRVPGRYTTRSWAPFAQALTTAGSVAADAAATAPQVAAAKTALVTAAAG